MKLHCCDIFEKMASSMFVFFFYGFAASVTFGAICEDTYHDRFECDGIVVHCVVWCDEIPDCRDGFDEANCPVLEPPVPEVEGCQGSVCSGLNRVGKWIAGFFGCLAVTIFVVAIIFRSRIASLRIWAKVRGSDPVPSADEDVELTETSGTITRENSQHYREESEMSLEAGDQGGCSDCRGFAQERSMSALESSSSPYQ